MQPIQSHQPWVEEPAVDGPVGPVHTAAGGVPLVVACWPSEAFLAQTFKFHLMTTEMPF